ncbi:MAG: relaxase/mobilization nuclease domain-containing protein [Puia sp.]|nr:relaxase/mobilization nuclease domain-containing protein [Puia sp.]
MVPYINFSNGLRRLLTYHEKKVAQGKAVCIQAGNFWQDRTDLDFQTKLERFEHRNALRAGATITAGHLILEFSREDHLSTERMAAISKSLMRKIGFEKQPWLVYQHTDAYQPHIHILTTPVKTDGGVLHPYLNPYYFLGPVRKSIEQEFGLLSWSTRKIPEELKGPEPPIPKKFVYGESEMNTSVSIIVNWVIQKYNYTNLNELNAVLGLYNVMANPGTENSRLRKFGGLYYHALDGKGKTIGTPIKASHLYRKPILKKLEEKFQANALNRQKSLDRVKTWAAWALRAQPAGILQFVATLRNEQIRLVVPENSKYMGPEVYYIDHKSLSVFADGQLGAAYSLQALTDKYSLEPGLSLVKQLELAEAKTQTQRQNRSLRI